MCKIKIGCPWAAAPCGRSEEVGCAGCPAFDEKEYAKIMGEEVEFAQIKAEIQAEREFLAKPENYFGPLENQW